MHLLSLSLHLLLLSGFAFILLIPFFVCMSPSIMLLSCLPPFLSYVLLPIYPSVMLRVALPLIVASQPFWPWLLLTGACDCCSQSLAVEGDCDDRCLPAAVLCPGQQRQARTEWSQQLLVGQPLNDFSILLPICFFSNVFTCASPPSFSF